MNMKMPHGLKTQRKQLNTEEGSNQHELQANGAATAKSKVICVMIVISFRLRTRRKAVIRVHLEVRSWGGSHQSNALPSSRKVTLPATVQENQQC